METKFYVGQRVKDERTHKGITGIVKSINRGAALSVIVDFAGENVAYTADGRHTSFVRQSLFHADPEPFRLTEWQRKQLEKLLLPIADKLSDADVPAAIRRIESIISEPEPPKYQAKQGDAVIFRDGKGKMWRAAVAANEAKIYWYGDIQVPFEMRPFDHALVGKVTD